MISNVNVKPQHSIYFFKLDTEVLGVAAEPGLSWTRPDKHINQSKHPAEFPPEETSCQCCLFVLIMLKWMWQTVVFVGRCEESLLSGSAAACKDSKRALEVSQHAEDMGLILGACAGGLVVLILLLGAIVIIVRKGWVAVCVRDVFDLFTAEHLQS